ncbi:Uncharacterized protein TCM_028054 [Theobroma cacao]|uniref:Uncharacterized protein n=1 Tax=Theobroma cacao TaxID=3641 RepID=A0A061GBA4_THECC|nr:Uncharacterized protein TCM_028054 [Theobroma cacao]
MGEKPLVTSFLSFQNDMSIVNSFYSGDAWDMDKLKLLLLATLINDVLKIPFDSSKEDVAYWTLTSHGDFSTRSAWEVVRQWQPTITMEFKTIFNNFFFTF